MKYGSEFNFVSDEFCDKLDSEGKEWRKESCSVEIRYKYAKEKHLLTKVHFFRDKDVSIVCYYIQ